MARNFNIFDANSATDAIVAYLEEVAPEALKGYVNKMLDFSFQLWTAEAKDSGPWGDRYASTLQVEYARSGASEGRVYSDESHPNAMFVNIVENGMKSFSIKDALLAGKAARRNKAKFGRVFVHVPFRQRTPKQNDQSKTHSSFAGQLPEEIYEIAKSGGRVTVDMAKAAGNENLAGLKRYGNSVHGQYMTFRTVSEKSQDWRHPGAAATPVFPRVEKMIQAQVQETILKYIDGLLDGLKGQLEQAGE